MEEYIGQCPLCGEDAYVGCMLEKYYIFCSYGCSAPPCMHSTKEASLREYEKFIDGVFGHNSCDGDCYLCDDFLCTYFVKG